MSIKDSLGFVFIDTKNEVLEATKVGRKFLIVKRRKTESHNGRTRKQITYYDILVKDKRINQPRRCQLTKELVIKGEPYWKGFNYQTAGKMTNCTNTFEQAMQVIDLFKQNPHWYDKPRKKFANNTYYCKKTNKWKTRDSGINWERPNLY